MSATANGFAHAFSTWIAGGNGLNSGKDGVMRYNSGPMKGMTRDAAQMKFQNQVWRNAPDAWKDEYAKRATTGMLSPSEQKAASGGLPTVRPPVRQATVAPMENGGNESGNLIDDQERDSKSAANRPMEILKPQGETEQQVSDRVLRKSQAVVRQEDATPEIKAVNDMIGTSPTPTVTPPIRPTATNQPAFGERAGTGASQTGGVANAKGSQPAFGIRKGTGASETGRLAQARF